MVGLSLGDRKAVVVAVPEGLWLRDGVALADVLAVCVRCGVGLQDKVRVPDAVGVGLAPRLPLRVREALAEGDAVDNVSDLDSRALGLGEAEWGLAVCVSLRLGLPVKVSLAEYVSLPVPDRGVRVREGLRLSVRVGEKEALHGALELSDMEVLGLAVRVCDSEGVALVLQLGLRVPLLLKLRVPVKAREPVADRETEDVAEKERVHVSVSVGTLVSDRERERVESVKEAEREAVTD